MTVRSTIFRYASPILLSFFYCRSLFLNTDLFRFLSHCSFLYDTHYTRWARGVSFGELGYVQCSSLICIIPLIAVFDLLVAFIHQCVPTDFLCQFQVLCKQVFYRSMLYFGFSALKEGSFFRMHAM